MVELIAEMLIYIGLAALLGLVLGYLIWGWGTAARISAARADGAAAARTSVDGSAGLSEQLQESEEERRRQAEEIEHLLEQLDGFGMVFPVEGQHGLVIGEEVGVGIRW